MEFAGIPANKRTDAILSLDKLDKLDRDEVIKNAIEKGVSEDSILRVLDVADFQGSNEEILEFCSLNYGVTFEMFKKVSVKGKDISPLYDYLVTNTPERTNKKVKWNFEKFLVNKEGVIKHRYLSNIKPKSLVNVIERELQ